MLEFAHLPDTKKSLWRVKILPRKTHVLGCSSKIALTVSTKRHLRFSLVSFLGRLGQLSSSMLFVLDVSSYLLSLILFGDLTCFLKLLFNSSAFAFDSWLPVQSFPGALFCIGRRWFPSLKDNNICTFRNFLHASTSQLELLLMCWDRLYHFCLHRRYLFCLQRLKSFDRQLRNLCLD
jgi:hypothetical protein